MNTVAEPAATPAGTRKPRRIAVIPVYNEEKTVVQVLEDVLPLVDEVVVVDDGSIDNSRELIVNWALNRRNIHTILFDKNRGLSAGYYAAFREIGAQLAAGEIEGDDLVITIDADGQHDPADLDRLTARVTEDGFDAAVARRDLSGYSFIKSIGNNSLSLWATLWAGTRLYDVESGFRVFRAAPLMEALNYYHGYRYSETVEVAVVLPRLGYTLANDVLVPVPVQRSRTSIRDGVIDALAMVGAWWRVFAGRHKPSDMPAWSMYVVPVLALLAIAFAAGDILRGPLFLASDSMQSYSHIWYLSDQIFYHANVPMHIPQLDSGRAVMFPYAIAPFTLGALIYPVLGSWAVGLLMVIAVLGTLYAAGMARPVMRDPWMLGLFVLNPFFIDAVLSFQFATVWSAFFFFLFVWAFEREKTIPAAALMWLTASSQPLIGSLAIGAYGVISVAIHRESLRRLLLIGVPVGLALIPIYWMTLSVPSLSDSPGSYVRTTLSSVVARSTFLALPFALTSIAPWLRRNYRPALSFGMAAAVVGVVMMGGLVRYPRAPSGYWGVIHGSSDVYAAFFQSPQFQPGMTYRVMEPGEREDGMYRFVRHGAVLSSEFLSETTFQRWWNREQYGCYAAYKKIDFVVIEQAWVDRVHYNEPDLLNGLVSDGQASLTYADPEGRFTVYNIQPFVAKQQRPESLSQCPL